jgi:hypothetical protein
MENALGLYNIVNSYQRDSGDGTSDDQAFTMSDKMQARFDAIKLENPTFTDDQIHDQIKKEDGSKAASVAGIAGAALSVASQFGGDENPLNKNLALKGGLTGVVSGASMGAKVGGVPGAIAGGIVMGVAGAWKGDKEQTTQDKLEVKNEAITANTSVASSNAVSSSILDDRYRKNVSNSLKNTYGVGDIDNFTNKYS